jgi:glycosyltransferase involved in cell wall biosynthesis
MRAHIFDPQLNFVDGHYANYDLSIKAELEARQIEVTLYGSRVNSGIKNKVADVLPVFSRDIFSEDSADPAIWALENFDSIGNLFYQDLASIDASRFRRTDFVFVPNLVQNQIGSIDRWLGSLPEDNRPAVVIKLSYLTHAMPYNQTRPNRDLIQLIYRFAIRKLAKNHARVTFCSDTEEIAVSLQQISQVPFKLLPLPMSVGGLEKPSANGEKLRVAYLGHTSPLKGSDLLPNIVRGALSKRNNLLFHIQLFGNDLLASTVKKGLANVDKSNLHITEGVVEAEKYKEFLESADIILLPYAHAFYGWASSGIFTEALSLGKIVIVPENTWMSRQLAQFNAGGVVFSSFDAKSITDAVVGASEKYSDLSKKAKAAAPPWRHHNSPKRFVDELISIVPP